MATSNVENPNQRQRLFQILVPLLTCLLTVGAVELGLAIFHPVPFSIETNMYFENDPYTGYRLKPGSAGYYQLGIPGNANSRGHRDVEVPLKKPPGVFRILVLGDSFTVGSNVRQEEAYPKALERLLKRAYGPRIEVVNTGIGGWDPFQYAQYFEHYGYLFEADLVLVGFFVGNDAYSTLASVEQSYRAVGGHLVTWDAATRRLIRLQVFLYDHSNLARLLMNRGPVASRSFLRKQCDDFSEQYVAIQKVRMPNHLAESSAQRDGARNSVNQIRRIKDRAGGSLPVIVALLPDENQVNPALQARILDPAELAKHDFKMPQSLLIGMFREIGLPTIDVLPAVLADPRCLYMNETHWTPEGHELAASVIFEQLKPVLAGMKALR
ncbi:MAG: GDSL-type esterase/lipase family protein [Bradyrhizobium sp.]|uniref:GDSL-type esterase/lipase family protein n=1 Tax=Bradyrhizobium sp. TaxID=376 RepID=UPI0027314696|nr:GDSL-type esterase/lipase family protein [Bradyrhizobium sp.]MDP1869533.1 GDSL-type esterase/lipase family protein [Bradyrhizobium sp.]